MGEAPRGVDGPILCYIVHLTTCRIRNPYSPIRFWLTSERAIAQSLSWFHNNRSLSHAVCIIITKDKKALRIRKHADSNDWSTAF